MVMEGKFNPKRQGVLIALAKVQRAREIMQCFQKASVKPSNNKKL